MKYVKLALVLLFTTTIAITGATQSPQGSDRLTADVFAGLTVRELGPGLTTGRVADVAIDPNNANVWYVATAFGGLWKTTNAGITFEELFPRSGEVEAFTLCCVVIDPKNSDVIWLGTGENKSQRSAHFGTGLYKSTDAGRTWTLSGLPESEHIGKILIDPNDSNVLYVAAQGPLFNAGGERGVYKTSDGGATWTRVLHVNDDTGFTDLAFDPRDSSIVFAGAYQRRRHVGQMIGGGPDGGIWRSSDAGRTWTKLTNGLPPAEVGRVALATDPKRPGRVYALIDGKIAAGAGGRGAGAAPAQTGPPTLPPAPTPDDSRGFYRSDDNGDTWLRVSTYRGGVPFYYSEIYVDPWQPDTIWSINVRLEWSRDGGVTWSTVGVERNGGAFEVHVDHQALAFNPTDPNHLVLGNDGGLYETRNLQQLYANPGQTGTENLAEWRFFANLPVTQFYRASAGYEEPFYTVCGGTQDNFSFCGPSRTSHTIGIRNSDWYIINGGDGFQTMHDRGDPHIVYATSQNGNIVRFDRRTGRSQGIRPNVFTTPSNHPGPAAPPPADPAAAGGRGGRGGGGAGADRPNWDAPHITSAHSPTRIYWGSQYLYRSEDRGASWERISPDLTRNLNVNELEIMGRVWPAGSIDLNASATALSNIVTIDESRLVDGLIYIGTDDGLIQITEDAGRTWRRVDEFPNVPRWAYVTDVWASHLDANVVFATLNNWQRGDFAPHVLRSNDRGRTWTNITGNLPARHSAWSIAQDHQVADLLFLGTEFGLFFTVDGGRHWVQLRGGMPPAQVRDLHLQQRENDIVMATFGRGFWILDDYSALRGVSAQALAQDAVLLPLRHAYQYVTWGMTPAGSAGLGPLSGNYTVPNPPYGAGITYHVRAPLPEGVQLVARILAADGSQVRELPLPQSAGVHREFWNLSGEGGGAVAGRGGAGGRGGGGTAVVPGRYQVVLGRLQGTTFTAIGEPQSFEVRPLPAQNYTLYR